MDHLWAVGLLPAALRLAPAATALALLLLVAAALLSLSPGAWLRRRGGIRLAGTLAAWAALSWILRDRLNLLGDAQLWLHSADALGLRTPGYREPLAVLLQMFIAWFSGGWWPTASVMAVVSCLCGAVTLLALWGYAGGHARTAAQVARLTRHALLLYGAPLSLIFFGHVETYPLFVAGLALAVNSNRGGDVRALMAGIALRRGRARAAVSLLDAGRRDVAANGSASAILATAYFTLGRPDSALAVGSERHSGDRGTKASQFNDSP